MLNNTDQLFAYRVILQNTQNTAFGLDAVFHDFHEISICSKPLLFNDCITSCKILLARMNDLAAGSSEAKKRFAIGVETNPEISGLASISGEWDEKDVMKWWIYDVAQTEQIVPLVKAVMSIVPNKPRLTN